MKAGENLGVGALADVADTERWRQAGDKGMATQFIDTLPERFETQLGRWFKDGQELSGGQWQKIALARAFMRDKADILVLDEPTAAMDAAAEASMFDHFRELSGNRMVKIGTATRREHK